MKNLLEIILVLIFTSISNSQTGLESIYDYNFEFSEYSELYDLYSQKKIHVNNVKEYIFEHPAFNPIEIFKAFGLKNIDNRIIKNFVEYDKIKFEQILKKDNYSTLNNNFIGNGYKQASRFELESKNFVIGGLIEKDIGERSILDNNKIFLRLIDFLKFERVIIGDFKVRFGQGLSIYQGSGVFKGGDPIYPVKKRISSIKENKSFSEGLGFRGVALRKNLNFGNIYVFLSDKNRDANLSKENEVTSLYLSGYHRTETENNKKCNLNEKTYGGRGEFFIKSKIKFGLNFYNTKYNKGFIIKDENRQTFNFTGNHHNVFSIDSDIFLNNNNLFFEYAIDKNQKNAFILGILSKLNTINYAIVYRNYKRGYTSFFENGFSESNNCTKNEEGYYFGVEYKNDRIKINGYFDLFKYSWRSFFNLMPIKGYEFSSKIEYKMSRYNNIKIKFYSKNKEKNYQLGNSYGLFTNSLKYYKRSYIRSEYYFKNNAFRYKFCLEYSLYSETSSQMEYEKHNFKKCGTIMENYLVLTPVKDLEFSFWHIYYLSGIDIIMFYKFEHDQICKTL